jgi:hypothetical protein
VQTFLVFEPANGGRDADSADRVQFVREKFYWSAFFFAPLWLLWHRLWLGFFGWLLAEIALGVATYAFDLDPRPPARPVAPAMPAPANPVIGLFPEPGAGR